MNGTVCLRAGWTRPAVLFLLLSAAFLSGCRTGSGGQIAFRQSRTEAPETITVYSGAFLENQPIPERYTGDGSNISPPIGWSGIPQNARSVVLIVEDPDAPGGEPYVHWLMYNIPPQVRGLRANIPTGPRPERVAGAFQGRNSAGGIGYTGPKPPSDDGPHHYHFQVFALDRMLDLRPGADRQTVVNEMAPHVIAKGQFVGTYQRKE